jgi:CheY-like chemotaxis protein
MRRRILLADDSVTIQKVIELTFLDEDYEVKAVSNGDEAIAALPQVNPDFVIADVHMPGANGYEVCRRAKEYRPGIPVLLLVGTFEPFDEGQSRAVGADSFLKKPFDSQELLQRVEDLLASRSAAAPAAEPTAAAPESDLLAMPSLSELPPLDLGPPQVEYSTPAADWGSFQVEPPPLSVSDPFPAPPAFAPVEEQPFTMEEDRPFPMEEDRPFTLDDDQPFTLEEDRPFAPPGESAYGESPFFLEDEPLTGGAPAVDESALLPAGEPLFDLDSTEAGPAGEPAPLFETPSFEEPYPSFETPSFESPSFEPPFSPSETVRVETGVFQTAGFDTTPEERLGVPQGAVPLVESRAETEARIEAPAPPSVEASHEPAAAPVVIAPAGSLAVGAASPANGGLSDGDVDRIARRVVELMADRAIRDVAWEVIPDMAEMVIRDRLRELETQAESFE